MQEHKPELILGKTPKTLQLFEDATGLRFELLVPDTSVGRDLIVSIERGDIGGCSFRFPQPKGDANKWTRGPDGQVYRDIYELDLVEITLTAFPAYPATLVEVAAPESEADKDYRINMQKIRQQKQAIADDEYGRHLAAVERERQALAAITAHEAKDKGKPVDLAEAALPARKEKWNKLYRIWLSTYKRQGTSFAAMLERLKLPESSAEYQRDRKAVEKLIDGFKQL